MMSKLNIKLQTVVIITVVEKVRQKMPMKDLPITIITTAVDSRYNEHHLQLHFVH